MFVCVGMSNGYSQQIPKLCICFKEETKYIKMGFIHKDSTWTGFSIIREGYETKEKRQKERIKRSQKRFPDMSLPPFYLNFYSTEKPVKLNFIKNITACVDIVTVNEFRQDEFKMPKEARSGLFIFIKKLNDGTFLKWDAMLMAVE